MAPLTTITIIASMVTIRKNNTDFSKMATKVPMKTMVPMVSVDNGANGRLSYVPMDVVIVAIGFIVVSGVIFDIPVFFY